MRTCEGPPLTTIRRYPFDEMTEPGGVRPPYRLVSEWLEKASQRELELRRREAELLFRRIGITFAVYSEGGDPERLIPFDVVPRVLCRGEWDRLAKGLEQRVRALNAFLHDVYHGREILRAGHLPEDIVLRNPAFRPEMCGFEPPGGVYNHVSGIDIVRVGPDDFRVLEDNCRTPSGVSYMLELLAGAGVCQDHAHIFVAGARCLGIPARYVSGYLHAAGNSDDALASHAWAEAFVPELGWVGFDPANGIAPTEHYIRTGDAAPVRGVRRGAPGHSLRVRVHVEEIAVQ